MPGSTYDESHDSGRSNDPRESLLHAGQAVRGRVRSFWAGFEDFVLRDNVLEVAVGLM